MAKLLSQVGENGDFKGLCTSQNCLAKLVQLVSLKAYINGKNHSGNLVKLMVLKACATVY